MRSLDQYEDQLREAGQFVTVQRRAMLRFLLRHQTHPTAAEVAAAIVGRSRSASLATIYNNLALFSALGIVRSVRSPDGDIHWDVRTDHHHHLSCTRCGGMTDIDGEKAEVVVRDPIVARRVEQAQIWFAGRCERCAQSKD